MSIPEATPHTQFTSQPARAVRRRLGPGRTVVVGLVIVAVGLLVALLGAQMVVSALGPAGAIAAAPALSGLALLIAGGLIECLGIAVFSKRLVSVTVVGSSTPAAIPTTALAA